jgi:hypothetical protein
MRDAWVCDLVYRSGRWGAGVRVEAGRSVMPSDLERDILRWELRCGNWSRISVLESCEKTAWTRVL